MFQSLKLGKFFGIDLYIHGTFWLLPILVLLSGLSGGASVGDMAWELAFVFAVFGCIVLHEVGHALAARAYGIGTRNITLYPIGGVASLERLPEKPWREIAIALAGPAVNIAIAAALLAGIVAAAMVMPWVPSVENADALDTFVARLLGANLVLAAFNLLPAFPMDGGRVLRALLATRLNRVRATEIAANVGTVVAGGFLVAGLYYTQYTLMALAVVVYLLGQAELAGVRARALAKEWRDRAADWFAPPAEGSAPVDRSFSGLAWDSVRRMWVQYDHGRVVRAIDPDRDAR